ncbi:uncharacterized protein LOC135711383 [Ochlerotatus camptorhynchus]|uniref:uncharacterized protein LOC135711383 n=1 Tax=Ochlerotatus camptorhynchus TaxID=644619 RepID=UPI0031D30584
MEDPRVAAFRASDQHSKAVELIDKMVLRGLDLAVPNNKELLNKFTEAQSANQVINTIALATGLISFDDLEGNEDSLETGNINLTKPGHKRTLKILVGQLPVGDSPPYRFVLIPLALGTQPKRLRQSKVLSPDENKWDTHLTLLVRTQTSAGDNCYIDMAGRVYLSFRKFLQKNKFPRAVLCYPPDGTIELDDQDHVKLTYAVVGEAQNRMFKMNTAAIIGAICIPNAPIMTCFAAYRLFRAGRDLVDCYEHGTLNPLKFPRTIGRWVELLMCLGYFINGGIQLFDSFQVIDITVGGVIGGITVLDLMIQENSWSKMGLGERTKLSFFLCFKNRMAPSLENGECELECMKLKTLCSTFKKYVTGTFNIENFKKLVYDMSRSPVQSTIAALLFLVRKLIEKNASIELSEDFATIKIGDRKLMFKRIVQLPSEDIRKFGELIDQLNGDFSNLSSRLAELFGDGKAIRLLA